MKYNKIVLSILALFVFFASCTSDDKSNEESLKSYDKGILVLNQGNFGKNDATLSYIAADLNSFQNDVFSLVNPAISLGDIGQSIGFYNDLAFIVLNNSNKIEIVNRYTLKSVAVISSGLKNPRYIAFANGKAFVTNWGDGMVKTDDYVAVIDLNSRSVTGSIPVIEGPECILAESGKLYVTHKGGFGYGNKLSVIDIATNSVATTIEVGDLPENMAVKEGTLWVACHGMPSYVSAPLVEGPGQIVKVSLSSNKVIDRLAYSDAKKHISNFVLHNNEIYYTLGADIYRTSSTTASLPSSPFFSTTSLGVNGIYSFAVHGNRIYVGDAKDYVQKGSVYVFSLNATTVGSVEKSFTAGVSPAGFYFND